MKVWVTFGTVSDGGKQERIPRGYWTQNEEYVRNKSARWKFEQRDIEALPEGVELDRMPDRWGT